MLMQTFKTANELGIEAWEHRNLIEVLRMMESGEIHEDQFDMSDYGECGTAACIGGWVAALEGCNKVDYINKYDKGRPLHSLYWDPVLVYTPSIAQGATALRNFLTTGEPKWDEVCA